MHRPTVDSHAKDMDGNACGRLGRNLFVVMWVAGFLSMDFLFHLITTTGLENMEREYV